MDEGDGQQAQPQRDRALEDETALSEARGQTADQPTLDEGRQNPGIGEDIAVLGRAPAEGALRPEGEGRFHAGEDEGHEEEQDDREAELRVAEPGGQRREPAQRPVSRNGPMGGIQGFPERHHGEDQGQEGEAGGRQARPEEARGGRILPAQETADGRAQDEAQAEGGADEAHALGALLRGRHIGDIGLRRGDIARHDSRERPGGE